MTKSYRSFMLHPTFTTHRPRPYYYVFDKIFSGVRREYRMCIGATYNLGTYQLITTTMSERNGSPSKSSIPHVVKGGFLYIR